MLYQLKYVWLRLVCVFRGHWFRVADNHVVCWRCNWCGGAAGAGTIDDNDEAEQDTPGQVYRCDRFPLDPAQAGGSGEADG